MIKKSLMRILGRKQIDALIMMRARAYRIKRSIMEFFQFGSRNSYSKIQEFGGRRSQVFFGYYDISPFSRDGNRLLAMQSELKGSDIKPDSELSIGYYELGKKQSNFIELGKSSTWCWQQGCRLQWYPSESRQQVIYNRLVGGRYGSVVQDVESKEIVREYQTPIYSIDSMGEMALSLNFSRLHRLRPGYGYVNFPDQTAEELAPKEDGLWAVNMKTGAQERLFSVNDIAQFESLNSMQGAEHYFNHLMFNPSGTRFLFFHLWVKQGKRYSRLITADRNGGEKCALINEGHVSHYNWKNDQELIAFATHSDHGMGYYLYRDQSAEREFLGSRLPKVDGHPSFSPDASHILTDTYPDRYSDRNLYCYSRTQEKLVHIGRFFSPHRFRGEYRCDLHPRWDQEGQRLCIDSAHQNRRSMYVIELNS